MNAILSGHVSVRFFFFKWVEPDHHLIMIKLIIITFLAKSLSAGSLLPSLKGPESRNGGPCRDQARPTGVATANHSPALLGKRHACLAPVLERALGWGLPKQLSCQEMEHRGALWARLHSSFKKQRKCIFSLFLQKQDTVYI